LLALAKSMLSSVPMYVALQRGIGADRLRYRCLDRLELQPGQTVLDVGCGPAYYLARMPDVRYHGFDTDPGYIAWAKKRWAGRGEFRCEIFAEEHLAQLPKFDAVMLLGLLHHMSDEQCRMLLDLSSRALAPGGRVVTVDTCFEPSQGRVSRWMSENDRGEYVRTPEEFEAIAKQYFEEIEGEVVNDATRVPASYWLMRMGVGLSASSAQRAGKEMIAH
jgi:cyclopropane fatty-acyl-phospholipid synthase-like methyltransferase